MEYINIKNIYRIKRNLSIFHGQRKAYKKARWKKKISRLKKRFTSDGGFGKKPKFR